MKNETHEFVPRKIDNRLCLHCDRVRDAHEDRVRTHVPDNEFLQELIGIVLDSTEDNTSAIRTIRRSEVIRRIVGMAWHAEMETGLFKENLDPDDIKKVLLQVASYLLIP